MIGTLIYYIIEKSLYNINIYRKDFILPFIVLISPLAIIGLMPLYFDSSIAQEANTQIVGEITGNVTVGQTFLAPYSNLHAIEILLATYNRVNTGGVVFHLRSTPLSTVDLYSINMPVDKIKNNKFCLFSFDPIKDSKGRSFYFFIDSPNSTPGNAITIWYNKKDAYSDGQAYENGLPLSGDLAFRAHFFSSIHAKNA